MSTLGQDNTIAQYAQYNQIQPNPAMYPQQYLQPGVEPGVDGQAPGGLIQRVKEGIPQTCGDLVLYSK